jgi:UDP-N-acetylmuramyl pentapeptide phosphotransferase/UDP-N-acetylglucosamine-1-phosphate transferase
LDNFLGLSLLITFILSALFSAWLSRACGPWQVLAHPNERSLHHTALPASGGVAILSVSVCALVLFAFIDKDLPQTLLPLGVALLLVAAISFADDHYSLPPWVRLAVHAGAAYLVLIPAQLWPTQLVLPAGCIVAWPSTVGLILGFLFVVWMINLYNFMDGMDGFAGGMAVFGFGTCALLGWLAQAEIFTFVNATLAAASGGFLLFNFPPARIFMGDMGAATLGLAAAIMCLWADRAGLFPLWVGIIIFSPFIVDATVTLLRRLLAREKIWHAHKTHAYQRLVQLGWGHKKTVLWAYILMAGCSASAFIAVYGSHWFKVGVAIFWIVVYTEVLSWITRQVRVHADSNLSKSV